MKKDTEQNRLSFDKDSLRRMNQGGFATIDRNDLEHATGGFSKRCPDCRLSTTTQAQD